MSHYASFDLIVLFFILGIVASWSKSDLAIPDQISKFLSIFLLLALGLKGGHEVGAAQDLSGFLPALSIGLISCVVLPLAIFAILFKRLGSVNAAALSASYGSVSAVTFITAQSILNKEGVEFSGYMVAIMALMEMPAILIAVGLYQRFTEPFKPASLVNLKGLLTAKSVVLLLGGFLIGFLMNERSWDSIAPVFVGSFKGVLAIFLLDLGITAQQQLREAAKYKWTALGVAFFLPLMFGSVALLISHMVGLSQGDQILLAVLVGSASYIAAPAAIRSSITKANPGLYLALPLALTFPMNLLFGIPFYLQLSLWLQG